MMACCESPGSAERLVASLTDRGLASRYDMIVTRFDRQGAELTYKRP
jgi:hypothetical protein